MSIVYVGPVAVDVDPRDREPRVGRGRDHRHQVAVLGRARRPGRTSATARRSARRRPRRGRTTPAPRTRRRGDRGGSGRRCHPSPRPRRRAPVEAGRRGQRAQLCSRPAAEGDQGAHQRRAGSPGRRRRRPSGSRRPTSRALGGSTAAASTWRSTLPGRRRARQRTWPSPVTTYLVDVISGSPIGPRACSFWVVMPISAPKPNSPPSVNRVDALTRTAAESTSAANRRAAARSLGDDRLGVAGGPAADVLDRLVEVGDDGRGDVEGEVLGRPVLVGGRHHPVVRREGRVAVDGHAGVLQRGDDPRQELVGDVGVHEQRLGGVADAGALGLGVEHDGERPCRGRPRGRRTRGSCRRRSR